MGAISVLVQKIKITDGQVSVRGLDGGRQQRSYNDVNVTVSDLSLTSRFPFKVSAKTPGSGSIDIDGHAGPFNMNDMAATPFSGTVTNKRLVIATTGFIDPRSGIGGGLHFSGTITPHRTALYTQRESTIERVP